MTLKIFVADDSITIQKIVALAFGGEDARIQSVSNGDSAFDEVRSFKPDIVLADVFMPGCNGYEVCERIKLDPELKDTPVVLLVGAFEPFDESEASRVKSDGCLTKPFDTTELIQMVHKLINKNDAAQPAAHVAEAGEEAAMSHALDRSAMSSAARASFLGADRILDLFAPEIISTAERKAGQGIQSSIFPKEALSEEAIDRIVERVVRRMSADVVREVAWEVVPELSEVIIRRTIQEQKKV
jgi:CheY-like chemotaxis protein